MKYPSIEKIPVSAIWVFICYYFTTKKIKLTIIQQVIIGDYDSRIKGNLKKRMQVGKVIVHESFVNSKTGFGKTKKGIVCQLFDIPETSFVIARKRH